MSDWDSQIFLWEEQMQEFEQVQADAAYWESLRIPIEEPPDSPKMFTIHMPPKKQSGEM